MTNVLLSSVRIHLYHAEHPYPRLGHGGPLIFTDQGSERGKRFRGLSRMSNRSNAPPLLERQIRTRGEGSAWEPCPGRGVGVKYSRCHLQNPPSCRKTPRKP